MEDRELENLIKQSAENLEVKDFSARLPDIQKIADNTSEREREAIFAKQPVSQAVGGRSEAKRNALIIVAAVFVFAVAVLAVIFAISFIPANSVMDGNDYTEAPQLEGVTSDTSGAAADAAASEVTEERFYAYFENAADFSGYNAVYYICDDEEYAGKVEFEYGSDCVTVYIYYTVDYNGVDGYEYNGLTYVFEGLSDADLLALTESLFGVAEEQ
ncbi:MAG: hypothetical protein LUD27_01145 [Clostridia bacterium]|nr:hypothetical protein [Clostridia bacterium]